MITADDVTFLDAFGGCTIPKACWDHPSHVRMAWLELERHGYERGLERIRAGIRRYNAAQLGMGYHETVTVAFTRLIHYRRLLAAPDLTWKHFIDDNADLLAKDPPALSRYYSRELLASDASKNGFVEPDLRPLPAAISLRVATAADAASVAAVYAPYVERTPISFELTPPGEAEMRLRLAEPPGPWLVAEANGRVVAYAYASRHHTREAYRWAVNVSAYAAAEVHRQGVGRALYATLLRELHARGYYTVFAGITLPNEASVAIHESFGFTPLGVYRNVGYKLGRWYDVGWWQKTLRAPEPDPQPPRSSQSR